MARLDYVEYENAPEELRPIYDEIKGPRPKVYNIHKLMGNAPELLKHYRQFVRYLREESVLERKLRELVILTVAKVTNTPYELAHHAPLALAAGVTREELEAVGKNPDAFSERYRAALRYAAEVAESGRVKDETFADLRRFFSPKEIVELTVLAGAYVMISRYLTAMQVDLEPGFSAEIG